MAFPRALLLFAVAVGICSAARVVVEPQASLVDDQPRRYARSSVFATRITPAADYEPLV